LVLTSRYLRFCDRIKLVQISVLKQIEIRINRQTERYLNSIITVCGKILAEKTKTLKMKSADY